MTVVQSIHRVSQYTFVAVLSIPRRQLERKLQEDAGSTGKLHFQWHFVLNSGYHANDLLDEGTHKSRTLPNQVNTQVVVADERFLHGYNQRLWMRNVPVHCRGATKDDVEDDSFES